MVVQSRKAEQSDRTRGALLSVARELFAERGYAATATEEIVQAAGVTRGALYHHFRDKQDLFEAVYREMQLELLEQLRAASEAAGPRGEATWPRIIAGFHAYLDFFMEPPVQRIMLLDAPAVMGWERWRAIDGEYGLGVLLAALNAARSQGRLRLSQPVEVQAHLLMGMAHEAAFVIAGAQNVVAARGEAGAFIDHILQSVRAQ